MAFIHGFFSWVAAFAHWYTTEDTSKYWSEGRDNALIALASVAAVVWTGGLIAYQFKHFTIQRLIAVDAVQSSFMGAVLALFASPLALRYIATAFLFATTALSIKNIWYFSDYRRCKEKGEHDPTQAKLSDEQWIAIARQLMLYNVITLLTMGLYIWAIITPYPRAIVWVASILLFIGFQTVVWVLANTPSYEWDRLTSGNTNVMMQQLDTVQTQLQTLITGLGIVINQTQAPPQEPPQISPSRKRFFGLF